MPLPFFHYYDCSVFGGRLAIEWALASGITGSAVFPNRMDAPRLRFLEL